MDSGLEWRGARLASLEMVVVDTTTERPLCAWHSDIVVERSFGVSRPGKLIGCLRVVAVSPVRDHYIAMATQKLADLCAP
jgi:hypothetical protein